MTGRQTTPPRTLAGRLIRVLRGDSARACMYLLYRCSISMSSEDDSVCGFKRLSIRTGLQRISEQGVVTDGENQSSHKEGELLPDVCLARAQSYFIPKLPALQNKEQQACNAGSRYKRRSPPVRLSTSAATAHPPAVSEDVFALHDGCTFGHDGKHGWPERSRSPEAVAGLGLWRCM